MDLEKSIISSIHIQHIDSRDRNIPNPCNNDHVGICGCWCEYCYSFLDISNETRCYESLMKTLDYILRDNQHYSNFLREIIISSNY